MVRGTSTPRLVPALFRTFHLTTSLNETFKTRQARSAKRKNLENRQKRKQDTSTTRVDPVLGHSNTEEGRKLWEDSELCEILLTEAKILGAQPRSFPVVSGSIALPQHLNFGIKTHEEELVFQALPEVMAQQNFFQQTTAAFDSADPKHASILEEAESKSTISTIHLSRLADLRNASAAGIAVENRRRCVETFSPPGKPNDTGRPEVQGISHLEDKI